MEDKQLEDALAETIEKSFNDSELEDIMNEIENLEKVFSDESGAKAEGDGLKLEEAKPNNLQDAIDAEVESIANEMESALDEGVQAEATTEEAIVEPIAEPVAETIEEPVMAETAETEEILAEVVEEAPIVAEATEADEEVAFSAEEIAAIEESVADLNEDIAPVAEVEVTQDDVMDAVMEQIEATEEETVAENVVLFEKPTQTEEVVAPVAEAAPVVSTPSSDSQVDFNASGAMDLNINFNVAGQTASLKVENGGLSLHMNGVQLTISEETGCSVKMDGGVQFSIPLEQATTDKKKNVA
jgi:hypothetical protein